MKVKLFKNFVEITGAYDLDFSYKTGKQEVLMSNVEPQLIRRDCIVGVRIGDFTDDEDFTHYGVIVDYLPDNSSFLRKSHYSLYLHAGKCSTREAYQDIKLWLLNKLSPPPHYFFTRNH